MSRKTILYCLVAVMTLVSAALYAQQPGASIQGSVVDISGKPMAGLRILARSTVSGEQHAATTNVNGEFNFAGIQPGRYLLQNDANRPAGAGPGTTVAVSTETGSRLALQADNSGNIQFQAETVKASSETASIKNDFSDEPVEKFPQPNGISKSGEAYGAYNLSLLGEGVTPGSIFQTGIGPSVGGRPNSSNNFEVNGIDNNNQAIPGPLVAISNEAVSNFTIVQGERLSQMGHSTGGQLNAILTPGTNLWHGGFYEYLNNRKLNAVEPGLAGSLRTRRYDQSRMGVKLNGPLVRNKLFASLGFEYIPLRSDRVLLTPVFAPTAAGYAAAATISGISATNLAVLQNTVGTAPSATMVTTVNGVSIPVGRVDTDIRTSTSQFRGISNTDWRMGSTSKLALLYGHNDTGTNAFGSTLPAFAVPGHTRSLLGEVHYTTTLSSGTLLNLSSGYNRYHQVVGGGSMAFPGLATFPNISIGDLGLTLGSHVAARRIRTNMYQLGGWADWSTNGHHIRFGADARRLESVFENLSANSANLAYSSFGRYLMDLAPDAGAQQTFGTEAFVGDRTIWSVFVEDRLRLRGMSFEIGVSYQYSQLPKSLRQQSSLASLSVPGVISFAEPKADKMNIAPHIAWAWSPGAERTTIRSGFGLLYESLSGSSLMLSPAMSVNTFRNSASLTPGFLTSGGLTMPATAANRVGTFAGQQQLPYIVHWNAGVSHALFGKLTAEFKYIGSHGVHEPVQAILNDPSGVSAAFNLPVFFSNPGPGVLNSLGLTQQGLIANTNALTAAGFTNPLLTTRPEGTSWYNAVVFKLNERFTGGSQISGEYTYADARSDATGTALDLVYGRRMEQSIWSRKHRATLTPVLDIASVVRSGPEVLRNAVSSLSIMATLTYERGPRVPLFTGGGTGISGIPAGSGIFVNPNGIAGTSTGVTPLSNSSGQTVAFVAVNPNAQFIAGAPGTFSQERPTMRLGDTRNIDLAILKRFAIGGQAKIEARADAYNLFNHPQFTGMPISTLGSGGGWIMAPGFLTVSNPQFNNLRGVVSGNPRTIQLAVRLMF